MANLLNGKQVAQQLRENIKSEVAFLKERKGIRPHLAVIKVGENAASDIYVRNKEQACEEVGIESTVIQLPATISSMELLDQIKTLNRSAEITGILVQLPLPKHLDEQEVIQAIDPKKDVDGFHPLNVGRLNLGLNGVIPCTPMGIMTLLKQEKISLEGKHVVVIGRSDIVGKPIAQLCLAENATVTICHSRTQNLSQVTQQADVVIVAIGKAEFIKGDMIKEGAIVIDVGINRNADGKVVGDVEFSSVEPKASFITPVPGGVGPMTIATLLANTLKCIHLF